MGSPWTRRRAPPSAPQRSIPVAWADSPTISGCASDRAAAFPPHAGVRDEVMKWPSWEGVRRRAGAVAVKSGPARPRSSLMNGMDGSWGTLDSETGLETRPGTGDGSWCARRFFIRELALDTNVRSHYHSRAFDEVPQRESETGPRTVSSSP